MVAVGLAARRYKGRSVRFTGPVGLTVNAAVIAVLVLNEYTATAAALFYGATLLVAAWRAQPGCEATVLSNWILRRDDQIGCPTLTPIDMAEARLAARKAASTPRRDRQDLRPLPKRAPRMTMEHQPGRRPDPPSTEEHGTERLGKPSLIHLAICIAIGVAVVIAIKLFGWLA